MPTIDFIPKLFELEDMILEDLHSTSDELHLFFSQKCQTKQQPRKHSVGLREDESNKKQGV